MAKSFGTKITEKFQAAEKSWTGNARRAMNANPDYFVWWYTVKSIGLAAAVGLACYYAGRNRGMREGAALGPGLAETMAMQMQGAR